MAAFITPIAALLDRILPDRAANQAAREKLSEMAVSGELQQIMGQVSIDKSEAQAAAGAKNAFVQFFIAGWRPAIGWLCGLGLLWQFFLAPVLGFFYPGHPVPKINTPDLEQLLFALLGMGTLRTVDKLKGKASGE